MFNEARYLEWNCELKTRLSDIVSHLCNNCCQTVTQQLEKKNLQCHFKSQKQTNAFFQSEPEVPPCFELN